MFAYSVRARTHAAHRMEDDVPQEDKLCRLRKVIDTFSEVVTRKNHVEDSDRLHVMLVQGPSRGKAGFGAPPPPQCSIRQRRRGARRLRA
ncbi:hypothetical protein PR001_g29664, partial [Phytophthora rubi]